MDVSGQGTLSWRHARSSRGLRRVIAATASTLLIAAAPGSGAVAGPAIAFDVGTGDVVHAHLPSHRWYPASLTKLMTVYLAFVAIRDGSLTLASPVRISELAASQPLNTMKYPAGHEITTDEAVRILLVKSANDVAVALAETVAGSLEAFVEEMNRTAARLGMADTHFVNPHGLYNPQHYSTARDLALLSAAVLRDFPQHQDFFAIETLTVGDQVMKNYNPLLGSFPGADGMKTGYICESGYNIVATAARDGRRIAAVVLGATGEGERAEVAGELLEKGFGAAQPVATLSTLPQSEENTEPLNLRPYVCGGKALPPQIASFGF